MTVPRPNMAGWLSWHVHGPADGTRTDHLTPLVADNLAELIHTQREAGALRGWFFIRYWEGGPHLRVRLLPGDGVPAARLDEAVRKAFAALPMEGHRPAEYLLGISALAAASAAGDPSVDARMARTVREPGVYAAVYEPETSRYGSGAALEATEDTFMLSSELALMAARSRLPGLQLQLLGLEIVLKAAALLRGSGGGEDSVPGQLRRHADYWRAWSASAGKDVFPAGPLSEEAARWAVTLRDKAQVTAQRLVNRASLVTRWSDALGNLVSGPIPASSLVISHTHMALNRLGIFVHEEFLLVEVARRLWAAQEEDGEA
ncbi:lantibiotic dehydratase C-terminal domain-containing protein [Streptomyces sp. NPDC051104]|uniref:lantibiotic dehydratase C-terminal domain-containing protein n=1 Tax=Streptomyces sp. NPDC051104 TaxID=3155044 RepID=UPI0034435C21